MLEIAPGSWVVSAEGFGESEDWVVGGLELDSVGRQRLDIDTVVRSPTRTHTPPPLPSFAPSQNHPRLNCHPELTLLPMAVGGRRRSPACSPPST